MVSCRFLVFLIFIGELIEIFFSLQDRMNELKRLGVEMLSISMLITDQNKFQKLVERIEYVNNLKKNLKK